MRSLQRQKGWLVGARNAALNAFVALVRSIGAVTTLVGLSLWSVSTNTLGQGCVAFHYMAPSHWPGGEAAVEPGTWQLGLASQYLYADQGYLGNDPWPEYATIVGNQITIVTADVQIRYAFNSRFSTTLTLPFQYGQTSNFAEHDGTRHTVSAGGLGDLRLAGTAWLLDPAKHENGNLSLGVGVKMPTGDDAATDTFYKPTGPELRPVDIAIQPGDGGWGIVLESSGYWRFAGHFIAYADGYYLINPRVQNEGYTTGPAYGFVTMNNSVADQYYARAGLGYSLQFVRGLSVNLGGRINGIPPRDLVGADEGFRRPGYAIYVEPGLTWENKGWAVSLSVPVLVDANRQQNIYEESLGVPGGGAFAEWLLNLSVSRTF